MPVECAIDGPLTDSTAPAVMSGQRRGGTRRDEASGARSLVRLFKRGPALLHGWDQPARRHRHLLEYRPSRRSGQIAETRRPDR